MGYHEMVQKMNEVVHSCISKEQLIVAKVYCTFLILKFETDEDVQGALLSLVASSMRLRQNRLDRATSIKDLLDNYGHTMSSGSKEDLVDYIKRVYGGANE